MDNEYHSTIRNTIQGLDRLLVSILTQGTAFVLAILSVGGALQEKMGPAITFWVTLSLTILTILIIFGVWLYSSLLGQAIEVCKAVENQVLGTETDEKYKLTHMLEKTFLAGGQYGRILYMLHAITLFGITAGICVYYGVRWVAN